MTIFAWILLIGGLGIAFGMPKSDKRTKTGYSGNASPDGCMTRLIALGAAAVGFAILYFLKNMSGD